MTSHGLWVLLSQVVFCLLALLFQIAVFRPMISALDERVKAIRSLLALIPNDVVTSIKSLKDGLSALMKSML